MQQTKPQAIALKDYAVPTHLIKTTDLHIELDEDTTLVTASLRITKNPQSGSATNDLILHGSPSLDTRFISIDDRELLSNEYQLEDDQLTLFIDGIGAGETFRLVTRVAIKPQENTALSGLYKSGDMFCSQCEAEGFRRITWFLDRPDVLSRYTTTIRADADKYPVLLSNGNETGRGTEGKKHWLRWSDPFNKPAYLFALVAGDLEYIEDMFRTMHGREVKLQIFTESHNLDKLNHAMASLKHSMAWDEQVYGREYDLDIFMIVAVDSFNMGAMENKGLNIFNTACVLARPDTTTDADYQKVAAVVAHEYFHNWSGNRVTCRDWFQLSLKEGFTVLREQQFSASMGSATLCRINDVAVLRSAQFPEDAGPMAHPIRPDSYIEINNFYTATVYEKGAEVVRMIHTLLGSNRFRAGTDLYFQRHDGQAVTTEDFVKAMEDATGIDLTQFRRWYSQAGTPILHVTTEYAASSQLLKLVVEQSCPATPGQAEKLPLHLPLAIGLISPQGDDIACDLSGLDVADVKTDNGFTLVLNLTEARQEFLLQKIESKPVLSLLRGFSAPVKLEYNYNRDDLLFLISHDRDGFNRWEAMQRLAVSVIQEVMGQIQTDQARVVDERLIHAFATLLDQAVAHHSDGNIDKAVIAAMLSLPTETYLVELSEVADIDAIHLARLEVMLIIGHRLAGLFLAVYRMNQSSNAYVATAQAIAQRSLKNVSLAYLTQSAHSGITAMLLAQLETADNMTDTSAALRILVNAPAADAIAAVPEALQHFYERWRDDALVIDQWFNIQASCGLADTLSRVKSLLQHAAFSMTNPNRMRSVVVAFAFQNLVNFHKLDGSGYGFLADCVIELNAINPQMAARVLAPLTRWRKYDAVRQGLMKAELERILAEDKLSKNVFEIVSKSV